MANIYVARLLEPNAQGGSTRKVEEIDSISLVDLRPLHLHSKLLAICRLQLCQIRQMTSGTKNREMAAQCKKRETAAQ